MKTFDNSSPLPWLFPVSVVLCVADKEGVENMTTSQIPVQRCQYCGNDDLGLGWQHGEALVTYKKHGLLGRRLRYLICRRCGAVVYQ